MELKSVEELDDFEVVKKSEKRFINMDALNKLRRRELKRTLDLIMKMDIPMLELISRICAIGAMVFSLIVLIKVS